MSDRYSNNDPTQPPQPPDQGQGKLVLGGFQDQSRSQRRPYQNPAQQPHQSPAQQPYSPPQHHAPAQQAMPAWQQHAPATHAATPYAPYQQPVTPGVQPVGPKPGKKRPRNRRKGCLIAAIIVLVLACILGSIGFTTAQRALAFGSAISTKAPLSTETGYMSTSDRVNLLILGFGGGKHDGANLTDSLVTTSMIPSSHHTSLVSVPRDLLVQYPPNSGEYTKVNAIYQFASNFGKDRVKGANAAAEKVSLITGLDVKYWMMIDFSGFSKLIDAIGGIDVYIPNSFTSDYPKNDDPNVDASWITVKFKKGNRHLNGAKAIQYARARYVTDNPAEGTDFARSARQQIIIKATLAKLKESSTWPNILNAMDALEKAIYTNMSLADLFFFSQKMDLNDPHAARVGLSTENVLSEVPNSPEFGYYLTAQNQDWNAIKKYVQKQLYK